MAEESKEWIAWRRALDMINERVNRPRTPQTFHQSILDVMEAAGDLARDGRVAMFRSASLERWVFYFDYRDARVERGEWTFTRQNTLEDLHEADAARLALDAATLHNTTVE